MIVGSQMEDESSRLSSNSNPKTAGRAPAGLTARCRRYDLSASLCLCGEFDS